MIIKLLKEESVDHWLHDVGKNFDKYKKFYTKHGPTDYDFKSPFTRNDYVSQGGYQVDDKLFDRMTNQMILDPKNEFESVRTIYTAFENLTPFEASQRELWVGLTHDYCHQYSVNRWNITQSTYKDRMFFEGAGRRQRMHNAVARLWWIGHLTVDLNASSENEKWRFTREICSAQDYITSIFEREIGAYKTVREGLLTFFTENEISPGVSKSLYIKNVMRDLNNHGGVKLLSMLDSKRVEELVSKISLNNLTLNA